MYIWQFEALKREFEEKELCQVLIWMSNELRESVQKDEILKKISEWIEKV